jgi:hypothetical protein
MGKIEYLCFATDLPAGFSYANRNQLLFATFFQLMFHVTQSL